MKKNLYPSIITAVLAMLFMASNSANALLLSQLGVLDLNTINPVTGAQWAAGDNYRLVFVTSGTRDATSTDIGDYNAFAQSAADNSSLGLGGATWNVVASTETVNARVNTSTQGNAGEAIYLVDGTTKIANNYQDFWNGHDVATEQINMDENATLVAGQQVLTGTQSNGVTVADRWLGTTTISNNQLRVTIGRTDANNSGRWAQQFNVPPTASRAFYALSDTLTVREIPEPATATLALLGLGGLMMRRRRNAA